MTNTEMAEVGRSKRSEVAGDGTGDKGGGGETLGIRCEALAEQCIASRPASPRYCKRKKNA